MVVVGGAGVVVIVVEGTEMGESGVVAFSFFFRSFSAFLLGPVTVLSLSPPPFSCFVTGLSREVGGSSESTPVWVLGGWDRGSSSPSIPSACSASVRRGEGS